MFRTLILASVACASAAGDVRVFATSSAPGYGLDLLGPQPRCPYLRAPGYASYAGGAGNYVFLTFLSFVACAFFMSSRTASSSCASFTCR